MNREEPGHAIGESAVPCRTNRVVAAATLFGLLALVGAHALATELESVDAVLTRLGKRDTSDVKELSPAAALMRDIVAFRLHSAQQADTDTAKQWLVLWDRSMGLDAMRAGADYDAFDSATRAPVGPRSLLAALPSPGAWPLIRAQAEARAATAPDNVSALGLKLLAQVLTRDAAAARQSLSSFNRLAVSSSQGERELKLMVVDDARALMNKLYGSREQIADGFRATIDARSKRPFGVAVDVPDLVGLVGPAQAEVLLADALKKPVSLHVPEGVATKALARKLAMRGVASLRKPQWGLVDDIGNAALYEAMQERFDPPVDTTAKSRIVPVAEGPDPEADYERSNADFYYFLDLVIAGRQVDADRAMARASSRNDSIDAPRQAMDELTRRGENAAVYAYLSEMLARRPQFPAWDFYLEQAGVLGHSAEAMLLLDSVLKRGDLTPQLRAHLAEKRLDALLGADQIDAAVAGFSALLALPPSRDGQRIEERATAAVRLAGLGRVLKHPEWSRLGIDFATKAVALPTAQQGYWRPGVVQSLLVELRREGLAESAQLLALAELERDGDNPGFKGFATIVAEPAKRSALVELVGLYDAAGRTGDVRRMLDDVGVWAATDVSELVAARDSMGTPIGLMVARALRAEGNLASAAAAARAVIAQLPAHDPAYQMFVETAGDASIAELDRMAANDPFEKRPLVWKAVALLRGRQYEAAEDTVRRAIAIDPSDGDQGVNDRLRAYVVLADILEARGDLKSADTYRHAVAAIRLSEQADELHRLGLYQRAFAGYRAALVDFSDAYCIQSRLAVQLGRQGFQDEALKHYRRAFELMPDSFGRVESHCFGCESVFAGPSAQAVADQVFTAMVKRDSTKPQVPYMLGYLRKEEGRYAEAQTLFRLAIALDATYLNAWRQLNDLGDKTYVDPGERDIARLRLLELDPQQRHVRYRLDEVADLPDLWRALARSDAQRARTVKIESVYPLSASIRAQQDTLAKLPPEMRLQMEKYIDVQKLMTTESVRVALSTQGLADHKLLLATLRLMGTGADVEGRD